MKKLFMKLPLGVRLVVVAFFYLLATAAHIGIVYYYNKDVAEVLDTKEIVVATKEIPIHSVIQEDDVMLQRVKLNNVLAGGISDLNEVIGKESQVSLSNNEQINFSKISIKVKEEGELIIELPQEWIISFPKSLRRFDEVNILPIEQKDNQNRNGSMTEDEMKQAEIERKAKAANLLEASRELLSGISVVYFKDNTANEITDDSPNIVNSSDIPRINSSNLGTRLEVAITNEQWLAIQSLYELNYKFVIGYK